MALLGALTGCVRQSTYDAKVAELNALRDQHDQAAAQREKGLQGQIDGLNKQVQDLQAKLEENQNQLKAANDERASLHKQLDESTALVGEFKKRLEKLGQNVDKLTSERGQLAGALTDAKARLDELRKQKETADALAATFKSLVQKLKSMIDAGQLKVVIREGRMLIALPNDVLFDSGKTDLKAEAKTNLATVAQVLSGISDRHFLVAGHTDNVPIHTARFASNWELSTQRAVEVTRLLVDKGMHPEVLAAAGYGEFDPVAQNDTPEHRALNRRIEIVLQPNLAELPSLESVMSTTPHP
ncbi:MAG: OmpA family protein [Deltaproteobacteria bacterium]|nr:OmpA family protein [Deltaproteobacteria bacterium]